MAAEQGRARGKASAATATRVQNALIDGSLCGILERLDEDPAFHRLVSGGMSIADGKDIAPIITHRLPYTEFREGFEAMNSGKSGKVVLDWVN